MPPELRSAAGVVALANFASNPIIQHALDAADR